MRTARTRITTLLTAAVLAIACMALLAGPALAAITVNGAGATFPYPLYSKWAKDFQASSGVKVNYQPIGSGGGIAAIKAGTVLFGGSDAPLTSSELTSASLVQFPMCVGGVVPIIKVSGVASGKLKLTGPVLAEIFLGKISKWDDSRIKALNPGVRLPASRIIVVHRSDASGTTWIYTHYLSAVSSSWRGQVGADKSVRWPVGVGAKGNEGVAALVKRTNNSIGYVEYAYAKQSGIAFAQLRNKSSKWVLPSLRSFAAAASGASWKSGNGFGTVLVNAGGNGSWPIAGASFVLVKKSTGNYTTARAMFKFFDWAYKNSKAKQAASQLQYVSMPSSVVKDVEAVWHKQVKAGGKAVW
jgi:phosphate transport system substrate-binding protein